MARAVSLVFLMLAGALVIATTNMQGVSGIKLGLCPDSAGAWGAAVCVQACSNDEACQGTKKCCTTACGGRHCIEAELGVVRPGTCPSIPAGMGGICGPVCATDGQCTDNKKCCHNGCGFTCLPPTVVHAGSCPIFPAGVGGICGPVCATDGECSVDKKCCHNGCGPTCLPSA